MPKKQKMQFCFLLFLLSSKLCLPAMLPATVLLSQYSDIVGHRNTIMGSTVVDLFETYYCHETQNEKIYNNNNNQLRVV